MSVTPDSPLTEAQARNLVVKFARIRDAFVAMTPAMVTLAERIRDARRFCDDVLRETGTDPSVSPDAMRWTPPAGEVPRWPV